MPAKRSPDTDTETPEAKKQRFSLGTNIIIVNVGKEKIRHVLHESILIQCPFFKKCLESGMREQHEKVINLPADDPEIFSIIVEWLYTNNLRPGLDPRVSPRGYIAAEKYGIHELQNVLMDCIRAKLCDNQTLSPRWVTTVWDTTLKGSKLRDLGLDHLHYCLATRPQSYQAPSDLPDLALALEYPRHMETFMADPERGLALMFRFAEKGISKLQNPAKVVGCVYHVHEDGEKCEKSR
ncbi:hypothetical protein H2200_011621 [Cladophialophora chaetospira]|uniref:BTB domain-containing protein n=1 Tax=Cladophialophora chaetospira TaxID=386627 RepID=A0AA38WZP9_9EURO|nr:hypothetical protein H2200_011621 [Cladophialophora chaetospira]